MTEKAEEYSQLYRKIDKMKIWEAVFNSISRVSNCRPSQTQPPQTNISTIIIGK